MLIACIIAIPILNSHLNIYFDDGIQHIARAYGTYLDMKRGDISSNVIADFTNQFGYSWNLFYGPLTTYSIIALQLVCKNFMIAYKLFMLLCLIFSGTAMYQFAVKFSKNTNIALLASIIYMTFPYHLTDWYTRNACGEFMAFIFIPMVFLGLYLLFNTTENHYYLTFGAAGLLLTHNISIWITFFFAILYILCHVKQLRETHVKKGILINIMFILTITSFFWIPMLETRLTTDYQVYEAGAMANSESVASHSITISQLFATKTEENFVFELGPHVIIMLVFSIMTFKKLKENIKKQYIFYCVSGIICLWMSTKYFPWKWMPEFMSIIQFPWRMLLLASFFLSIVCSINMSVVIKNFHTKDAMILLIICVIYTIALKEHIPYANESIVAIENCSLGIMSGKENENVAGTARAEYLPVKAFQNRFYIATRENASYVLQGKAIIEEEEKIGSRYTAKIQTLEEQAIIELPYIYYPGYEVRADGMIEKTFETENGFLGIALSENDTVTIEVKYKGTQWMKISKIISLVSMMIFGIYVWKER